VLRAADGAVAELRRLIDEAEPVEALAEMKFAELGHHPSEDRRLNLIEQVNQTFTYLASVAAATEILRRHENAVPIWLNLGTSSGSDVESPSAGIAAEVFAAVRPTNNRKLVKDVQKVAGTGAQHKYVFYYCPDVECVPYRLSGFSEVEVVPLERSALWGG
jgi:hypothetical protein